MIWSKENSEFLERVLLTAYLMLSYHSVFSMLSDTVEWRSWIDGKTYQNRLAWIGMGLLFWYCVDKISLEASNIEYLIERTRKGEGCPIGKNVKYMKYYVSEKKQKVFMITCFEILPAIIQLRAVWSSEATNVSKIAYTLLVLFWQFVIVALTAFIWKNNADEGKKSAQM